MSKPKTKPPATKTKRVRPSKTEAAATVTKAGESSAPPLGVVGVPIVSGRPPKLPLFDVRLVVPALSQSIDWGLAMSGVPELWKEVAGDNVKVAVLDTGCDINHPDLRGQFGETRDFTGEGLADGNGHGTHCCGVVAAIDNQIGIVGVAPKCQLIVGKVLGNSGGGDAQAIADAIDWASESGADIISGSFGSPDPYEPMGKAIERAISAGKICVFAAGNEGAPDSVGYPARWKGRPNVSRDSIAVGSYNRYGKRSQFSSMGPEVDIMAPGEDVMSTWPGGRYAKLSGTSMATPFISGLIALMVGKHRKLGGLSGTKTLAEIREHIKRTSRDAGPTGKDPEYGFGFVDPRRLLAEIEAAPPVEPPIGKLQFGPIDFWGLGNLTVIFEPKLSLGLMVAAMQRDERFPTLVE